MKGKPRQIGKYFSLRTLTHRKEYGSKRSLLDDESRSKKCRADFGAEDKLPLNAEPLSAGRRGVTV